MIAKTYGFYFGDDENVLKLWQWLHNSVNIIKTIELYTLNGCIVYELYMNSIVKKDVLNSLFLHLLG